MNLDFSLILTLAVLITGAIWAADVLLFRPGRRARCAAAEAGAQAGGSVLPDSTRQQLLREPWLVETAHGFFPVLAVVWVLRSFIAEPFTIPSGSMLPTLEVGDYVLVNKFSYGVRLPVLGTSVLSVGQPARGDIMVFKFPEQPSINYIKRVIGLPGDVIESREEILFVNGNPWVRTLVQDGILFTEFEETTGSHRFRVQEAPGSQPAGSSWRVTVPEGHYFVMGDNRDNSNDSRFWGTVPESLVVGRAFYRWMHKTPGLHWPTFQRNGTLQ